LLGKTVLIVEDNVLLADGLLLAIEGEGGTVVGPVGTVDQALTLIEGAKLDGALIDVRLADNSAEIARTLLDRGVPFIVLTGYDHISLPPIVRAAPYTGKPMEETELIEIARLTFRRSGSSL
jgi:DNA-binding NarL/FixJ family response regulator